jgi:hypothetical protein
MFASLFEVLLLDVLPYWSVELVDDVEFVVVLVVGVVLDDAVGVVPFIASALFVGVVLFAVVVFMSVVVWLSDGVE